MSEKKDTRDWGKREVGALWINVKQSDGSKYLTGHIKGEKVILFKNKSKEENPKAPDFRVYLQKEQELAGVAVAAGNDLEEEQDDLI